MPRDSGVGDINSAFDLFLDAISNTFGGVLFVALLVCLLIQLAGSPNVPVSEKDLVEARKLQAEIESAKVEVAKLEEVNRQLLARSEKLEQQTDRNLATQFSNLTAEKATYQKEYEKNSAVLETIPQELTGLQTILARLRTEEEQLKENSKRLGARLQEARQRETQRIRLPKFRETEKTQVVILVINGRMYFAHKYDGRGDAVAYNLDDFSSSRQGNTLIVTADKRRLGLKPRSGISILAKDSFHTKLKNSLSQFRKESHYLHFAVWPDSYREFEILRDEVLDMDFGFGLLIMSDGEFITFGAGGKGGEM